MPTIAALAAAMAVSSASFVAHAIVGAEPSQDESDAGSDADVDAGDADAPDAASCPPMLGGVAPPTRVHGSGCGCGGESSESSGVAMAVSAAAVAIAVSRRRR